MLNAAGLLRLVHEFVKRGYEVLVTLGRHFRDDVETENSSIFDVSRTSNLMLFVVYSGA